MESTQKTIINQTKIYNDTYRYYNDTYTHGDTSASLKSVLTNNSTIFGGIVTLFHRDKFVSVSARHETLNRQK